MAKFVRVSEPALLIPPPLPEELPCVADRLVIEAIAPASTWKTPDKLLPERLSWFWPDPLSPGPIWPGPARVRLESSSSGPLIRTEVHGALPANCDVSTVMSPAPKSLATLMALRSEQASLPSHPGAAPESSANKLATSCGRELTTMPASLPLKVPSPAEIVCVPRLSRVAVKVCTPMSAPTKV